MTGWAQIHGWRGEIDDPLALRRRVEFDLYYIENWSIWLDLRILALTPLRLLDTRTPPDATAEGAAQALSSTSASTPPDASGTDRSAARSSH